MKKILFLIMTCATLSVAHAYDYPLLSFRMTDGSTKSVDVESLTLTVVDGTLVVKNNNTDITLQLSDLDLMYFVSTSTGIAEVEANSLSGEVEIISISGMQLGRYSSIEQAKAALQKGIYIIKTSEGTRKISIR